MTRIWMLIPWALGACSSDEDATAPNNGSAVAYGSAAASSNLASASPIASGPPQNAACKPDEVTLFQCERSGKTFAICGGDDRGRKRATYRALAGDAVELEYPTATAVDSIQWSRKGYSGGGEIQYRFQNQAFEYIVYSRTIRASFDQQHRPIPEFQAGVIVRRAGEARTHIRCDNPEQAGKTTADPAEYMPEGEFLYSEE